MPISKKKLLLAAGLIAGAVAVKKYTTAKPLVTLNRRVALVTGGSRGLGLVVARQLLQKGARVAVCARDKEELERARADLESYGSEVMIHVCDITNQDDVKNMMDTVSSRLGPIDILINNAGTMDVGPYETMKLEDFELAMKVHFWGPLYAIRAVLPSMKARGEGRIVNITSIGGKISVPHMLPYSSSKFALVGLSEGLHGELAKDGIVVTTVIPGLMRTGSPRNARFRGNPEAEYAWFRNSDVLPFLTVSAEQAATQIIDAIQRGKAELIISAMAQIDIRLFNLFPEFGLKLISLLNRAMPNARMDGGEPRLGSESSSLWSETPLTKRDEHAARAYNQLPV